MTTHTWTCRVQLPILRTVDGDTFDAVTELPFGLTARIAVRLLGADAWDTEDGADRKAAATAFTDAWLREATGITLVTFRPRGTSPVPSGAFGRWLADVTRDDGRVLAADLLESGHAQLWTRARWRSEAGREARDYWDRSRAVAL